jgi:hypothetical protein
MENIPTSQDSLLDNNAVRIILLHITFNIEERVTEKVAGIMESRSSDYIA